MYCIPYTGFGTFMYRNLTVLKAAGIDASAPIKDWADWLAQMQKIKAAGKFAIPDETQVWQSVAETYAGVAGPNDWGADFDAKKTKVDPAKFAEALKLLKDMKPYTSGTSRNDQATKDLFISNQLAFHIVGPWVNPTYEEAATKSGLKYDYVLVPGATTNQHGGIKGYEFLGVAPGKNAKVAFEFAAYITEKNQMLRWAKLLSRFNANNAAMSDPSVTSLPLMKMTIDAVDNAHFNMPPYFVGSFPACYRQILTDKAAAVADGDLTPEAGAKDVVDSLNKCLSEG
jgi:multiple sugar transport system substrate-binding protein